MTRTFIHSFDPASASPVADPTVDLQVSEIEDAGIREVLQTPGAAFGAWSILDALLTATGQVRLGDTDIAATARRRWRRGTLLSSSKGSTITSRPVSRQAGDQPRHGSPPHPMGESLDTSLQRP